MQADYQRRSDLIPNLVATVQGEAKQEKAVLIGVTDARARATASPSTPPSWTTRRRSEVPAGAGPALQLAGPAAGGQRELPEPEVERELPGAAVAAGRHREPHRHRPARLQ